MASYGNVLHTNFSRSVSHSIIDQHGNEIPIDTILNKSIEIIIPRDTNFIFPEMIFQNVTSLNKSFHFKLIQIKSSYSIHFDIYPFNLNISYLFIYQFGHQQIKFNQLSGFTFLCPSSKLVNIFIFSATPSIRSIVID